MKRFWVALIVLAVGTGLAAPPAGAEQSPGNSVSFSCTAPPNPQPLPTCAWYPMPVQVTWDWTNRGTETEADSGCNPHTEMPDSPFGGNSITCTVTYPDGTAQNTALLGADATPPTFTVSPGPDHNGWYNHPEPLTVVDASDASSGLASDACHDAAPYAGPDGPSVNAGGGCTDLAGNTRSVVIPYDATPPSVTVSPDRQPDHNGWYNHPVSFTVSGADATSGLASCAGNTTYSGPANGSASVLGSCIDNAGNSGIGGRSFQYDANRPSASDVLVTPGNHRVELTWTLPSDATSVVVVRAVKGSSAAPKLVYSGSRRSLVDKHLHNGTKYSYTVSDIDPAGNSTAKTVRAIPTGSSLRPYVGSVVSSPPLLTWKKVKRASYYNVQLYLGRTKVLSTWPRKPSLQLPQTWHYRGQSYTLAAGHYRWYVWPGFGRLSSHRYGDRIGRSSFRVR
jgi:hypothetical protein